MPSVLLSCWTETVLLFILKLKALDSSKVLNDFRGKLNNQMMIEFAERARLRQLWNNKEAIFRILSTHYDGTLSKASEHSVNSLRNFLKPESQRKRRVLPAFYALVLWLQSDNPKWVGNMKKTFLKGVSMCKK